MENIKSQFKRLQREVERAVVPDIITEVRRAMPSLLRFLTDHLEGFSSVTGNLRAGIAIGAYWHGTFIYAAAVSELDGRPTMRQLGKGETYPLSTDYWGNPMKAEYTASHESGRVYADDAAMSFLSSRRPLSSSGLSFIVVAAADYAAYYQDAERDMNVLEIQRSMLASSGYVVSNLKIDD